MAASLNGPSGNIALTVSILTIGRAANNLLVLSDQQASSHHAEVRPDAQGYVIVDLNSTNGTYVNEQRLAPQVPRPLMNGDVIRIGAIRFTYEMAGSFDPTMRAGAADFVSNAYQPTVATPAPSQPDYQGYQPPQAQPPSGYGAYGQQPGYPQYQSAPSYPAQPSYQQPQQPQQPPFAAQVPPVQQGYPQQQWGAVPGQVGVPQFPQAQAAPPKKSHTGLIILIVVLLLVVVGGGAGAYLYFSRSTPEKTLQAYCTALENSDAQGIFNLESTNAQQHATVSDIRVGLALIDSPAGGGGVKNCTVGPVTNNNGTTADGSITVTLGNGKSQTSPAVLVNQNGSWKVGNSTGAP